MLAKIESVVYMSVERSNGTYSLMTAEGKLYPSRLQTPDETNVKSCQEKVKKNKSILCTFMEKYVHHHDIESIEYVNFKYKEDWPVLNTNWRRF